MVLGVLKRSLRRETVDDFRAHPASEGVRAFERVTAAGHPINVMLRFAVARYEEIAETYLCALEDGVERGEPVDRIASVASFFVSRVDTKVDQALDQAGRPDLKGGAAVANARLAYQSFRRPFSGERWQRLRAHGANLQRPLWASMSTKDPAYPDTFTDPLLPISAIPVRETAALSSPREQLSRFQSASAFMHASRTGVRLTPSHSRVYELRPIGRNSIPMDDVRGSSLRA